ncbi:MAG: hypothetical protein R3F13_12300 [Prosthecobacter sp.]
MTDLENTIVMLSGSTCGLLWTLSYILIIRRAALDKAHAMPLAPLCVNVSYEFIFAFIHPSAPPLNVINMIWFGVDLIIFWQYLRYARAELPQLLPPSWFLPLTGLCLAAAFIGVLTFTRDVADWEGNYTGWGDQMLISITMVMLLLRRSSVRGQSIYIVLSRMLGSISLIPLQYIQDPRSRFLAFVYVAFVVCDSIYIALYIRQCRLEGINPWKRL